MLQAFWHVYTFIIQEESRLWLDTAQEQQKKISKKYSRGISIHAMICDQQRCEASSMEAVFVSVGVVLVVQVQAKTKPGAGFAECSFLRF
jgi:hypothetical protein